MTPATARVRKHRAALEEWGYGRLDVWIAQGLIRQSRELARHKGVATWEIVQAALEAYVSGHTTTKKG